MTHETFDAGPKPNKYEGKQNCQTLLRPRPIHQGPIVNKKNKDGPKLKMNPDDDEMTSLLEYFNIINEFSRL